MDRLPDDALVVRGGQNLPENFARGSGVAMDTDGKLAGISVDSAAGKGLPDLTAPDLATGYPGIPHRRVGVTTVGAIRAAGGEVSPSPRRANPYHATLGGLTPGQAAELFRPTVPNPARDAKGEGRAND
jgi:hypothetical protein